MDNYDLNLVSDILKLKKEKDICILAHYYTSNEVQAIADFSGDSFFLSKKAISTPQNNILFCGVRFMGESTKLLNPQKHVYMADQFADCPMAHMITETEIAKIRNNYTDVSVVCYINSTTEIKAASDVCITSSNALSIIQKLPQKNIFCIPDRNLAQYLSKKIPEKNFILGNGYCHVHTSISKENLVKLQKIHPHAKIISHPECNPEIITYSDHTGSTKDLIEYVTKSNDSEFIVCTENGILYELKRNNPDKQFYTVPESHFCPNMKKNTLEGILTSLQTNVNEIIIDDAIQESASQCLYRMMELAE